MWTGVCSALQITPTLGEPRRKEVVWSMQKNNTSVTW